LCDPHLTNPRLRRHHQLIEAVPNLEERVCPEHDRPLELFCKDHSHFICLDCTSAGHKDHKAVPLKEECEAQLTTVKEQIKQRLQKINEIRGSVELSQKNADSEIQEGISAFNTLIEGLQQSLDSFKQSIEEKHKKSEEEAAQMIEQIQAEISALEQRGAEIEQHCSSGDHLQFVQTFTSAKPDPQLNDWKNTKISATYDVMLAEAVSKWKDNQLGYDLRNVLVSYLKRFQQYAVDVTLDENTAHHNICLENYSTKAQYTFQDNKYPNNPKRLSSKPYWKHFKELKLFTQTPKKRHNRFSFYQLNSNSN
uniref:B box-type domain-containing protein n=1 Tax=Neogobius melanostomus TaxID=47308 RepID=A0A8C6SFT6_9GOBI